MKHFAILAGMLTLVSIQSSFSRTIKNKNDSYFRPCLDFGVSKPLRELAKSFPAHEASDKNPRPEAADALRKLRAIMQINHNPNALDDGARQKDQGSRNSSSPLVNFVAQPGDATPPDPSGAAGPNHYVQAVNDQYRAYDKNGTPLMASLDLKSIWSGSINDGDPIVLYDKFADRWFIQQFQNSGNKILIAISTTPDPTGTFYKYTFVPNATDFPDYPKFSIWPDGYYMTANLKTQRVAVFERTKMLLGDPMAGMIVTPIPVSTVAPMPKSGFFSPLTLDADGQLPPNGTPNYLMYYLDDNQQTGVKDAIAIHKITTNWANKTATIVFESTLPTQAFNAYFTGGTQQDIAQPGTQRIDALDGFFAYRAPYRIWTGYNSIVLCNTVNLGNKVAGIRWYELRQDNTTKIWSIYQQGTYGPADTVSRWTPSIAMDDNGSIGLAYAVSSSRSVYPGLRYTGRLAGDPLGEMTFTEKTAIAGTSSITEGTRWGDYSHTSLDPDGITFWHTGEYCSSGPKTRVFSFQISDLTGIARQQILPQYNVYQDGTVLHVNAGQLPSGKKIQVDLFEINGKQINGKTVIPLSHSIKTTINVNGLTKGHYLVRIGNAGFQHVIKVLLE